MRSKKEIKDILIAYIPSGKDLAIAANKHWYRIPCSSKNVPLNIRNNGVKLIAFYQPKIFREDAFAVRWFAKVKQVKVVKRKQLLKDEPLNPKSDNKYYKIELEKLYRLPKSIISRRHRRILFITTTFDRFEKAEEINDLFLESPLEEKFWEEFKLNFIPAERQYMEAVGKNNFYLDFAIFCKNRKLGIECDGDTYHTDKKAVLEDKRRDNQLENRGWNIFRYSTEDVEYKFEESILQVKDTINRYGGLEDMKDNSDFQFSELQKDSDTLFG